MREILFRGKKIEDREWIVGNLTIWSDKTASIDAEPTEESILWAVLPETVGQYTGLTDKNGKKIFEGDIVKNDWCFMCGNSVVKFDQYKPLDIGNEYQQGHLGFYLEHIHKADKRSVRKDIMYFANNCEIIGNIHDNPELLKGE
jgi:uncharacterized phage protein (TIGR01671 family)